MTGGNIESSLIVPELDYCGHVIIAVAVGLSMVALCIVFLMVMGTDALDPDLVAEMASLAVGCYAFVHFFLGKHLQDWELLDWLIMYVLSTSNNCISDRLCTFQY